MGLIQIRNVPDDVHRTLKARATAELGRVELAQLGVRRHPDLRLLRRAWELRDVCATCDALYVALAEALDAALVTRDSRLAQGVDGLVDVIVPPNPR
jgi:predicted nucleic acid-binding protein